MVVLNPGSFCCEASVLTISTVNFSPLFIGGFYLIISKMTRSFTYSTVFVLWISYLLTNELLWWHLTHLAHPRASINHVFTLLLWGNLSDDTVCVKIVLTEFQLHPLDSVHIQYMLPLYAVSAVVAHFFFHRTVAHVGRQPPGLFCLQLLEPSTKCASSYSLFTVLVGKLWNLG